MRHQISAYLDRAITTLLLVVVGLTPLIFTELTTDFFELPKLAFLSISTLILAVFWSLSWVIKGKVTLTRTPIDLPLLMLLIVILVSTFFSSSSYVSIFGNFPRVHGSSLAWITYIIFYFVTISHLRTIGQLKSLYYVLLGSAAVVSAISLLSFFGIYLPLAFAKAPAFSPTGSIFSTVSLLILLLPLPILSTVNNNKFLPQPAALALSILFLVTIIVIGNPLYYAIAAAVVGVSLFVSNRGKLRRSIPLLGILAAVVVVVLILTRLPLPGSVNIIKQKKDNFPKEVQLGFMSSWKVAVSSFRDKPFLGSGPSTFKFDFTSYKPVEHNASRFWNFNFENAHNEFLQVLAGMGLLGLLGLIFLSLIVVNFSVKSIREITEVQDPQGEWNNFLTLSLAVSALAAVALMLLHFSTIVSIVASLVILAMLMAAQKGVRGKIQELTVGIKTSTMTDSGLIVGDALPIILFIPIIILVIYSLWNGVMILRADFYHRLALKSVSTSGKDVYDNLVAAERLNPRVDLYRIDLANTNFALANAIASQKGPTESSPGGSLTDEDKRTIQQLLSQAINEARAAVTISPRSASNWELLAAIYRQISGVAQNALSFSLDAYGRAIQRDPLNPILRLNVGGVYYSIKNYDLAIRFFTDAANLKPDYANAYYNLSIALRDKGDLIGAQATAERVVQLLQSDTKNPDYKTASDYLADLKARIATGSASQQANIPPAAQVTSALQQENLPNVLDDELKEKPQVATPPAVRNRQSPQPSPR